jgi:CRISPR/Cas system-associated protein endoribonuclease Cas2
MWLERYRRICEDNFQRMDTLLNEIKTNEKKRARTKR